jgi:hypothetical protein
MRHVLAPVGEDPVGEAVIGGDRVTIVEAAIDPVVFPISGLGSGKRLEWCKGNSAGGRVVQNPDVQTAVNLMKLYVRAMGRKSSSRFPPGDKKLLCMECLKKLRYSFVDKNLILSLSYHCLFNGVSISLDIRSPAHFLSTGGDIDKIRRRNE